VQGLRVVWAGVRQVCGRKGVGDLALGVHTQVQGVGYLHAGTLLLVEEHCQLCGPGPVCVFA
jgi:hypothetical protein